jgi:DNA polymerase-3 subunit alpha
MEHTYCRLGFISEHSLKKSAIKITNLETLNPDIPLAAPDLGNMSGLIRLNKKRKNVIPSVTLTVINDYSNKYRSYDRIRLYAYSHNAYIALCEAITTASQHSYYEPRLTIADIQATMAKSEDLYAIVDEEFPFVEELNERCYVAVNSFSTLSNQIYFKLKPIYFYDVYMLKQDDIPAFRAILSDEKQLKELDDKQRQAYYNNAKHQAIAELVPGAIENYNFLLNKEITKGTIVYGDKLPIFSDNDNELFKSLTYAGFAKRYPNATQEHHERLEFEIETIIKMGFPSYFLIVWDFIDWSKRNDIPIGPGRGSACGSIVSYCLGITELCPLEHGLFFERFLNPDRISMPDIDIDISQTQRKRVIEYLENRYGKERVSQIITFGLMKSKISFKDAARISGITPEEAERVTKLWPPAKFGITPKLSEVEKFDSIQDWIKQNNRNKDTWAIAQLMEEFVRQEGVHAAGVVISPTKMTDYAPVTWKEDGEEGVRLCQFDKNDAESYGLLKMDLLGLKNLDILQNACKLAGISFNTLYTLPLNDRQVYEHFRQGDTHGIFQFESRGMQDLLRRMEPTRFDDLSAANALYRPGPLQAGLTDQYVLNKINGVKEHFIPEFEELLGDTYEVLVYQEQIMKISRVLANFTMAKADNLRKAIGKKDKERMQSMKREFIDGAVSNGYSYSKMETLWDQIEGFGDYCFNKAHSAAYAMIAYCCMWLKVHHAQEFALALLNSDMGDSKTMANHFFNFKESVNFEYPKMNLCSTDFIIQQDKVIIGLSSVKELGDATPFTQQFHSLNDFLERVKLDKSKLTNLIKCGFFDDLPVPREVMLGNVQEMLIYSKNAKISKEEFMFDIHVDNGFAMRYTNRKFSDKAKDEQEAYGFYVKEGFIIKYAEMIKLLPEYNIVGTVSKIKRTKTRAKQEDMAIVSVFTSEGEMDLLMFPQVFKKIAMDLFEEKTYIFKTTYSPARNEYGDTYIIDDMILGVQLTPTYITITNTTGYNQKDKKEINVLPVGKIPVEYSGYDIDEDKTEKIGYVDVFDLDYIKTIPSHLKVTVNVF